MRAREREKETLRVSESEKKEIWETETVTYKSVGVIRNELYFKTEMYKSNINENDRGRRETGEGRNKARQGKEMGKKEERRC